MHTVIPVQRISLDPYQQPPFDHATVYSNVYQSHVINQLFRVFGDNCLIDGFEVTYYDINQNGHVYVTVGPGKAVVSSTLVIVDQEVTVDLNVAAFPVGRVVLVLEYLPEMKVEPNPATVKLHYVWEDGTVTPDTWREQAGNVILGLFRFTMNPYTIFIDRGEGNRITIQGQTYEVRPLSALAEMYLRETLLICEAVVVTDDMVNRGWFDLSHRPLVPYLVEIVDLDSGLPYTSVHLLGDGGDFRVDGRRVYIRGAGISGLAQAGDALHVKYLAGGE